jgi:hypothetical protein
MTQEYAINMPITILGPVEQVTAKSSPGRVGTFVMKSGHSKTPGKRKDKPTSTQRGVS